MDKNDSFTIKWSQEVKGHMEQDTPQPTRLDAKKARAVEAARDLFLERKLEEVKMTDIAARAGMGVASLYRYFETKETIVIAVATLLWQEIKAQYLPRLESEKFREQSGIAQIQGILAVYAQLLEEHRPFLRFLSDFDAFCIQSGIPKERLNDYETSINDFYRPYLAALEKGAEDGTVVVRTEPQLLYLTVNHAMLALLKKITAGEILRQDAHITQELEVMEQIILQYFQREKAPMTQGMV
jgi:AcrR family transcriptional regulator